ncbi:hypothetical protein ATCC90586_006776 [Pythium insidiosum]|nr:hypothetical protein ATCC90586_006776 [Pythium insidiosum]
MTSDSWSRHLVAAPQLQVMIDTHHGSVTVQVLDGVTTTATAAATAAAAAATAESAAVSASPATCSMTSIGPQFSPNAVSDFADVKSMEELKIEHAHIQGVYLHHASDSKPTSDPDSEPERARLSPLELKRLRNRECMRRARMRKQNEVSDMKAQIAALEHQLHELQMKHLDNRSQSSLQAIQESVDQCMKPEPNAVMDARQLTCLRAMADALVRENISLRDQVREKERLREVIAQLLEQEEQRKLLDEQQEHLEQAFRDQFPWLRHVLPTLKLRTMSPAQVCELVQQSCQEILSFAGRAETFIESPNRVFGWSDKRVVDDQWVHFSFSKDFAHADLAHVVQKSWDASSDLGKISAFQPRTQRMVLLQRWDDDTIVIARNLCVPQSCADGSLLDRNFCTVMLVFRLRTPDGGVLIGTRTLQRDAVQQALLDAGEHRVTYVDLCYGLLFEQLRPSPVGGCRVRFGGRVGNGTRLYAQIGAMDVLLATLRWENYCIAPLNRIAAT